MLLGLAFWSIFCFVLCFLNFFLRHVSFCSFNKDRLGKTKTSSRSVLFTTPAHHIIDSAREEKHWSQADGMHHFDFFFVISAPCFHVLPGVRSKNTHYLIVIALFHLSLCCSESDVHGWLLRGSANDTVLHVHPPVPLERLERQSAVECQMELYLFLLCTKSCRLVCRSVNQSLTFPECAISRLAEGRLLTYG